MSVVRSLIVGVATVLVYFGSSAADVSAAAEAGHSGIAADGANNGRLRRLLTAQLDVPFLRNDGQIQAEQVAYYSSAIGGMVFVGHDGNQVFVFTRDRHGDALDDRDDVQAWGVRQTWLGGDVRRLNGGKRSDCNFTVFHGDDSAMWRRKIPAYTTLELERVYPGIDADLTVSSQNLKTTFRVDDSGDIGRIQVMVEGATGMEVTDDGALLIHTGWAPLRLSVPVGHQEIAGVRHPVDLTYRAVPPGEFAGAVPERSAVYGIQVIDGGEYDTRYPLFISYSADFPGENSAGHGVAVDSNNDVIAVGRIRQMAFPTTTGLLGPSYNASRFDLFLAKYRSDLSEQLAVAVLGGSENEVGHAVAIDRSGNVVFGGSSCSTNFPTTSEAFDGRHNGGMDVVVGKLTPELDALVATTFIGGANDDDGWALAVDSTDHVYVTGTVASSDFPTTDDAYQLAYGGGDLDGFICRLSPDLSTLSAATYVGGGGNDRIRAHSVALVPHDDREQIYMTGTTSSINFPSFFSEADVVQAPVDDTDVFAVGFNFGLTEMMSGARVLTVGTERAGGIGIDDDGDVVITGDTVSTLFPTTDGAFGGRHNGGTDLFIVRFDRELVEVRESTLLGSPGDERAAGGLVVSDADTVIVAGGTMDGAFPVRGDVLDDTYNGGQDMTISALDGALATLSESTFVPGTGDDQVNALIRDDHDGLVAAGYSYSSDFPSRVVLRPGPHHVRDAVVTRIQRHVIFPVWGAEGDRERRVFRRGNTTVTVNTDENGVLLNAEMVLATYNARGELVWMELYNYTPHEGAIISGDDIPNLAFSLLSNPVVEHADLSMLTLESHQIVFEAAAPPTFEVPDLPEPEERSPDET